jgi:phytanoyl-CoA hydroxylase
MLNQSQIDAFRRDGFLIAGNVLTNIELTDLRTALDAVLEGSSSGKPELFRDLSGGQAYDAFEDQTPQPGSRSEADGTVIQIVNIWEAEPAFRKHLYHPSITRMSAQLIGTKTLRIWHDQIQYKPPRGGGITGWHQDYPAWPVIEPADLVSAWVALDDVDLENGAMRMVPGSHEWGTHPGLGTGESDDFDLLYDPDLLPEGTEVDIEPIEIKAGDVAFHHCMTWHGSAYNKSDRKRRAIAVHYMPGHTRFVPRGAHVMDARVQVAPGEELSGTYFPTVYDGSPLEPPQTS